MFVTLAAMKANFSTLGILVLDTGGDATAGVGGYLGERLRELGVQRVFAATDTDQANAILAGSRVDAVIVNCPGGDAVPVSRALRPGGPGEPACPPIILVAGADDHTAVQRAFDAGIQNFLATPITKAAVAERLVDLAGRAAAPV